MSKPLAPRTEARNVLTRILDQPGLVRAVQALPPAALLRLIDRVGLEDAGELVALATVEQLRTIFDEDLWRSVGAGQEERFCGARFVLWLEVMLEAGERFVADKLADLPEELVALALQHEVLAVSLEELALLISEGEGQVPLEKIIEDSPYLELGDYCVIARHRDAWDTVGAALLALDEWQSDTLQLLLERLWRATSDYIYGQGSLYEVLTSEQMLEADAAAEREDRRARAGFVSASAARGFLALVRTDEITRLLTLPARDPLTGALLREYDAAPLQAAAHAVRAAASGAEEDELSGLLAEIAEEGTAPRLLEGGREGQSAAPLLAGALVELAVRAPDRHEARMRELGYLANALVAGVSSRGERLRPLAAAEAALATCSLGLERALCEIHPSAPDEPPTPQRAVERLQTFTCDLLFRVGRRVLLEEVTRPAAAAIERIATRQAAHDPRRQISLERLAAAARQASREGRALSNQLEALVGALEEADRARLAALTDELPTLLALAGSTAEWIASPVQVASARRLLERL